MNRWWKAEIPVIESFSEFLLVFCFSFLLRFGILNDVVVFGDVELYGKRVVRALHARELKMLLWEHRFSI